MPPVIQKDRAANEFRTRAAAARAELLDPAKNFTKDELEAKAAEIRTLEQRAQLVAGFTADEETANQLEHSIDRGEPGVRRNGPGAEEGAVDDHGARGGEEGNLEQFRQDVQRLRQRTRQHFGGVTGFIRRAVLGHRNSMSAEQARTLDENIRVTRAIVGATGDASGGEFLLPLQQDSNIFAVDNTQPGILQGAQIFPVTGRTFRLPFYKQTDATQTRPMSGIAAVGIIGEGAAIPIREGSFAQRLMTVYKLAAITQMGNETLQDDMTGQMESTLTRMIGGELVNEGNFLCTSSGTGVGMPLAALHATNAARILVARKTANQFAFEDAVKMYARHTHGPRSFWAISRRVFESLALMTLGGNTVVTWTKDLQGKPVMSLLGYPVVMTDFLAPLGSEGDVALINPEFYAVALRRALTVDSSEHVGFINDLATLRFLTRLGGLPIPDGTYAYRSDGANKIDEHSPFVVLDDAVAV